MIGRQRSGCHPTPGPRGPRTVTGYLPMSLPFITNLGLGPGLTLACAWGLVASLCFSFHSRKVRVTSFTTGDRGIKEGVEIRNKMKPRQT